MNNGLLNLIWKVYLILSNDYHLSYSRGNKENYTEN